MKLYYFFTLYSGHDQIFDHKHLDFSFLQQYVQGYDAPAKGETPSELAKRMKTNMETNVADDRGLHETVWWYDQCRYREANGGKVLVISLL